jgi:hypothetical protein
MCPCSCDYKAKLDYWASKNDTNHTIDEWRAILAPVVAEIRVNLTVDDTFCAGKEPQIFNLCGVSLKSCFNLDKSLQAFMI